jgi:tripartite-type tricarboxylate transporter receptor subunit TctC
MEVPKVNTNFRVRSLVAPLLTAVGLIGLALGGPTEAAADEFYKGKTIRFIVGFAAGGGFDTYTRMIARHIGKHIPGNPDTVVENMTGAGSLIAANYMYNRAEPDGLTIGNFIGPLVLQDAIGNKAAKFDGTKFGWLGVPTPDSGVCVLTKASGISTIEEWFKAKEPVKLGGTAPGSTTDDVPKLVREAIGLPIKMIEGYKGTARIRVAAESGELDGGCWAWQSIKATWTKALDSGEVRPVLQTMLESHPELKSVPLAANYAKTDQARELLKIVDSAYGITARPYSVPPGMSQERLLLLQKAFMATMKDPELLAEAKKAKLEINPVEGPAIANIFAGFYTLKESAKTKLRAIVLPGKQPTSG